MKRQVALILFAFILSSCSTTKSTAPFPQGKIIDLSYPFDEETIYWPTEEGFKLKTRAEGTTEKGYFYFANRIETAEHGGTHIDAPRHFHERGRTVDEIPLGQLVGDAVLIDVSKKCSKDRDYQIRIEDFLDWERANGPIPKQAIVLLKTGFGRYWPDRVRYMGTDERGEEAVRKLHFPGLYPEAARWLAVERMIKAVGIDTPSIDYGQSVLFESHVALFEKNVPALENLADLDRLPLRDFVVIALPMKIKRGSGGPTRVIAIVGKT